jgi:uncharacterized protein
MRGVPLVVLVSVLAGCGSSPPVRYFALESVAPQSSAPVKGTVPIKMGAVQIPPVLDRRPMVRGETDHELTISSQERWASSFGEMVAHVLTEDLKERLSPATVISPNMPAPQNARGLRVSILTFSPDKSGSVVLRADWMLLEGSPPRVLMQRAVQAQEPGSQSASDEAAAMSRLLGKLADQIAAGVATETARNTQ